MGDGCVPDLFVNGSAPCHDGGVGRTRPTGKPAGGLEDRENDTLVIERTPTRSATTPRTVVASHR